VALKEGVSPEEEEALVPLIDPSIWQVELGDQYTEVVYRGERPGAAVYEESVGNVASLVSQLPKVREALLQAQRSLAEQPVGLIAEGRDCGSVVFPNATVKVFLTADQTSRAQRRASEKGENVTEILAQQKDRDRRDSQRKAAPMKVPEGAEVVDTTGLELPQVIDRVEAIVQKKGLCSKSQ
jgi:cytidylate kinase